MEEETETQEVSVVSEGEFTVNEEGEYEEKPLPMDPKLRSKGKVNEENYKRQQLCWELYVKSFRNGTPNAREAAKRAGYSPNSAVNITNFKWFKERKDKLRRSMMMTKAEKNLSRMLNVDYSRMELLPDGTEKEVIDKDIMRVVADISKTIVTTLGKDKGYSTKTEVTGNMGGEIKINSVSYADQAQIEQVAVQAIDTVGEEIIKQVQEQNGDNTTL
jgi:hypothetical protein